MKKLFYFAFASLLALGTVACDDGDDNKIPHKSLSAAPLTLEFTATPEVPQTIAVKAENVRWKATTEAGWLTLTNAEGTADGTIGVSADPNETTDVLQATIVIRAEGVEDVTVTVSQQAGEPVVQEPAIIWERSSRSRMNFQGKVKTASTFGLYQNNAWEHIDDLLFDANGMLTSYTRSVSSSTISYSLSYDAENRLTKCAWSDSEGEKSFELTYGTHGQYIYTENLFNDISFSVGVTNFSLWLPRYIKNLETVVCRVPSYDDPSVANVLTYSVEVTGDTGKIYAQDNGGSKDDYTDLAFTDGFTTQTVTLGWFGSTTDYTVNPQNGNLLQYVSDDGYSVITVKYNDDRINSLSEIQGDISTKMEYYENLDVKSVTDPDNSTTAQMAYEYDAKGNWTKMTVTGEGATAIDRSLTYFE